MTTNPIVDTFDKYFYAVRATTPQLYDRSYNIRYKVYCQEFKFEPEERFPDEKERDGCDDYSYHCLLIHKPTGTAAGCVRLITADKDNSVLPLPFERFCPDPDDALSPVAHEILRKYRDSLKYGEISRLAVISDFRRRKTDEKKPISISDENEASGGSRLAFPLIPVSLVLSILAVILSEGYEYGFCMMEPRLARMLARHSLIFEQVGDVVDYHGFRGSFVIARENILCNLFPQVQELMQAIQKQLTYGRDSP